MRGKQYRHSSPGLRTSLRPHRPQLLSKRLRQHWTIGPTRDKLHFHSSRGRQYCPPVESYAGPRVLRRKTYRLDAAHTIHAHLRNDVRDEWMPVSHSDIDLSAT